MLEKLGLTILAGVWAASTATFAITETDRAIMFCRIFAATFIGLGRTIGP